MKTTKSVIDLRTFCEALQDAYKAIGPIVHIVFETTGLEAVKSRQKDGFKIKTYTISKTNTGDVCGIAIPIKDGLCEFVVTGKNPDTKVRAPKNMCAFFSDVTTSEGLEELTLIDVGGLDVSLTTNFRKCFAYVGSSRAGIPNTKGVILHGLHTWDVSNAKDMNAMFMFYNNRAKEVVLNVSFFNVKNAVDFNNMFAHCGEFSEKLDIKGLEGWTFGEHLVFFNHMFEKCGDHTDYNFNLSNWKSELSTKTGEKIETSRMTEGTFLKIQKPEWLIEKSI